jgi:hypothetical protein
VAHALIGAALAATLAAGCGRPPDEAWLRIVSFQQIETRDSGTGSSDVAVDVSSIETDLSAGGTDYVIINLLNSAATVDKSTGGTGITVERAVVSYRMGAAAFPSQDLSVYLYIPAAGGTADKPTGGTGSLERFPIVTASLKQWILANVPGAVGSQAMATVTLHAETDEGNRLESSGSIGIIFK